jgi:hypothetical protein
MTPQVFTLASLGCAFAPRRDLGDRGPDRPGTRRRARHGHDHRPDRRRLRGRRSAAQAGRHRRLLGDGPARLFTAGLSTVLLVAGIIVFVSAVAALLLIRAKDTVLPNGPGG